MFVNLTKLIARASHTTLLRPISSSTPITSSSLHAVFFRRMSSAQGFKQEVHKLLVIPGPIEVADDVLYANAHPSMSHVSAEFIPVFGDCIRKIRKVLITETAQPFLIAGSGTLGWDQVAANLVEPGEKALVLHSGYFGDSFADALRTYGADVDEVKAELGMPVLEAELENSVLAKKYKVVTFTHVDTSTGVLSNARRIAETVRRVSPDTLVVLDGVCSVASEEIRFDEWDIDIVMTATQKGLGTPSGLSIVVASKRAIEVFSKRKAPIGSYYASWKKWLPIMQAYEQGTAAYFATPPVNLIYALAASLARIVDGLPSLDERFRLHQEAAKKVREAVVELGLKQIPLNDMFAANGMTAVYYPEGIVASDLLPLLAKRDVVVAGGLHNKIKDKYFRIGHMGITVVDSERGDVDKLIKALQESVGEARAKLQSISKA